MNARALIRVSQNLPQLERMAVREAIMDTQSAMAGQESLVRIGTVEVTGELIDAPSEETIDKIKNEKCKREAGFVPHSHFCILHF